MLSEILKALLITSLAGTCLTAVITIARPITKKIFGYAWHYYIWLAVLAVMILPVRFTLPQKTDFSPVTVQTVQTAQNVQTVQTAQNSGNTIPTVQTEPKTDIWQTRASFAKRIIDNRLNILAYLWLTGAIMMILINLIGYIRLIIKMRKNSVVVSCPEIVNFTHKKVTVRVWENILSPFMTGIFKPTLVLPARELTEEQLNNILRHEMTHFKRHDILYKWLMLFVKCVHWFNPVIWYVSKQINTECEISCDMAVTLTMNKAQEMSYIDTVLALLPTEKTKQIPLTTQMASSKKVLKRRFEMIRNKRETSRFVSALSAVIAVVMLGTTVFASGVLSDLATDDYTIVVTNNGEEIKLENKPFIENDTVYLPLREMLNTEGIDDISYNSNGYVEFLIYSEKPVEYRGLEYDFWINRVQIGNMYIYIAGHSHGSTENAEMRKAPVLLDGVTYAPYDLFEKLKESGQGVFDDLAVAVKSSSSAVGHTTIEITNNGERIEFVNQPFNENGEIYVPLRELFENVGAIDNKTSYINWDNGKITVFLGYGDTDDDRFELEIGKKYLIYKPSNELPNSQATRETKSAPVLKNYVTYIPYSYIGYMLNYETWNIDYAVYDKNGNLIDRSGNSLSIGTIMENENNEVVFKSYDLKNPENTVNGFFSAFSDRNFTLMKNYCTQRCKSTYFGDGYVFGMTEASLEEISIDFREYVKSSNDFNVFVTVNMTPHENSVFDPSQTSTSFYVILERQSDGRYLIDEFATGL